MAHNYRHIRGLSLVDHVTDFLGYPGDSSISVSLERNKVIFGFTVVMMFRGSEYRYRTHRESVDGRKRHEVMQF